MGGEPELVALHAWKIEASNARVCGAALRDGVEHRLDVRRRTADHAQDLARRRLLLQGLGEVAIAGFQLLEQPHVFDRDDRLVGEGLEQRDLLVGESAPGSGRPTEMAPIAVPSRSRGTAKTLTGTRRPARQPGTQSQGPQARPEPWRRRESG